MEADVAKLRLKIAILSLIGSGLFASSLNGNQLQQIAAFEEDPYSGPALNEPWIAYPSSHCCHYDEEDYYRYDDGFNHEHEEYHGRGYNGCHH